MMSQTQTKFKPKSCPKCNRNHTQPGVLCEFCKSDSVNAMKKEITAPDHYWIECKIDRDGDTELNIGLVRYTFKRNKHGHAVCQIINAGHYNQILRSSFYVPYDFRIPQTPEGNNSEPDMISVESFTQAEALLIFNLTSEGFKPSEIAEKLTAQRGIPVTRQKITRYLSMNKEASHDAQ
jgi:hypothetical protein